MELEKLGVYIGLLCIAFVLVVYESYKTTKKYNKLKEDHERLKNELKLLRQENFYLKQFSRLDNTNW